MTDDRLAALEARVAALESDRTVDPPVAPADAVDRGGDEAPGEPGAGAVGYRGEVSFSGDVTWRIDYAADAIARFPVDRPAAVLAALGQSARLHLMQQLVRGPKTVTELAEIGEEVGAGSTGQLYHHLNALVAVGLVVKQGRGKYAVAAPTVVPVLIAILAAADIAGSFR